MSDLPVRPRFSEHRRRFVAARYLAALARVEAAVLGRRFTAKRSERLDKALVNYESKGAA